MKCAEDQVSSQRCLDGYFSGLQISDLTNHNHVGILSHNRSEPVGKTEIDLRVDLNLANSLYLVFDGVFHGDDILIG